VLVLLERVERTRGLHESRLGIAAQRVAAAVARREGFRSSAPSVKAPMKAISLYSTCEQVN